MSKQSTRSELARVERLTSNRYAISRHRTSVDRPEDRSSQDSMRIDIPRSTSILRFSNSGRDPTACRGQSLHFINPSASRQVGRLAAHRPMAFRGGGKDIAPGARDQPLIVASFPAVSLVLVSSSDCCEHGLYCILSSATRSLCGRSKIRVGESQQ